MSKEIGAHEMNDTTRDELVTEVSGEVEDAYHEGVQNGRYEFDDVVDFDAIAQRIIALVQAARDAEIREALGMRLKIVNEADVTGKSLMADGMRTEILHTIGLLTDATAESEGDDV